MSIIGVTAPSSSPQAAWCFRGNKTHRKELPMFKKQNDAPATSFRIEAATETRAPSKGVSVLGPTLTFRGGELSSDEDLIIEGTVEGDLHGDEGVQITATARVIGNVVAPRVSLEPGAKFEGSITTKEDSRAAARATQADPADAILDSRGKGTQGSAETPSFAMRGSAGTVTR